MKDNTFSMIDEYGNERLYDILFTFDDDSTGRSYIVYTDSFRDEKGNVEVYASVYSTENNLKLTPIETDEEWLVVETILNELQEKFRKARKYS